MPYIGQSYTNMTSGDVSPASICYKGKAMYLPSQLFHSSDISWKESKSACNRDPCKFMFMEALFATVKIQTLPRCPQWMSRQRNCDLYIWQSIIQQYGRIKSCVCRKMGKGEWNKTRKDKYCVFFPMQNLSLRKRHWSRRERWGGMYTQERMGDKRRFIEGDYSQNSYENIHLEIHSYVQLLYVKREREICRMKAE